MLAKKGQQQAMVRAANMAAMRAPQMREDSEDEDEDMVLDDSD
jgi:hypothetical protein